MELYEHSQAGVNGYCKHVGAVVRSSWFCREWFWGHFTQHVMHWKTAAMAMICDLLECNDYKPVIANEIEQEIAKCRVLIDYACHPGKQTPGTEFKQFHLSESFLFMYEANTLLHPEGWMRTTWRQLSCFTPYFTFRFKTPTEHAKVIALVGKRCMVFAQWLWTWYVMGHWCPSINNITSIASVTLRRYNH